MSRSLVLGIGLGACLLLIAAYVVSFKIDIIYSTGRYGTAFRLGRGCIGVMRPGFIDGWSYPSAPTGISRAVWWPYLGHPAAGVTLVMVPLWCPLILVMLVTAAWWRRGSRVPAGLCPKCTYDLTGNVSGVCPECGTPISTTT